MIRPIWHEWLARIDAAERPGTLVYIGCSSAEALDVLTATDARRILVADATLAAGEIPYVSTDPRVRALAAVPGGARGTRKLYRTSLAALSSLSPPDRLFETFPGLRSEASPIVEALPLEDMLAAVGPPAPGRSVLRVELAGGASDIVAGLARLAAGRPVDHLMIRIPDAGLYRQTPDTEKLRSELMAINYLEAASRPGGSGFAELWFRYDPAASAAVRLARQVESLEAERNGLEQARLDAAESRDTAVAGLAETRQELEHALRLKTLARNDIDDLRGRYEQVLAERHALEEFLAEVTSRLQTASRHLHALTATKRARGTGRTRSTGKPAAARRIRS